MKAITISGERKVALDNREHFVQSIRTRTLARDHQRNRSGCCN